jgi:hypothetical protein
VCAAFYIWWDYNQLIMRQGCPIPPDIISGHPVDRSAAGSRPPHPGSGPGRAGRVVLLYTIAGPYLPEVLRHRGLPLDLIISDMYLTTTGIFGVPLGVSTDFVFLFVLFGALLDKAGGGKYFIDIAFSALGTFRGGPAKASVWHPG